jgi:hypothetical protein
MTAHKDRMVANEVLAAAGLALGLAHTLRMQPLHPARVLHQAVARARRAGPPAAADGDGSHGNGGGGGGGGGGGWEDGDQEKEEEEKEGGVEPAAEGASGPANAAGKAAVQRCSIETVLQRRTVSMLRTKVRVRAARGTADVFCLFARCLWEAVATRLWRLIMMQQGAAR